MTTHILKTYPDEWDAVENGYKRVELRSNEDRKFNIGDTVYLVRQIEAKRDAAFDPTCMPLCFDIEHIVRGGCWGLADNVDAISIPDYIYKSPSADELNERFSPSDPLGQL